MDQSFLITLKSIEDKFSRCIVASKQNKNNFNIVISNQDIDNLILNANLIAGFASMSLIEAAILEKSVLSIQFGNNINPNTIFKKICSRWRKICCYS